MRKSLLFLLDICLMGSAPLLALVIRDNLEFDPGRFLLVRPYMAITVPVAASVFLAAGVHRGVWRYASLPDFLRLATAATATILVTLFVTFHFDRLDGLPRSIPVIEWFVAIAGLCGTRVAARLWRKRDTHRGLTGSEPELEHILVIGLSRVTELYLESIAEFGAKRVAVLGVLAEGDALQGRKVKLHEILAAPECLLRIVAQFETHGVSVGRVVVAVPPGQLSESAREALAAAERSGIAVDFLAERLFGAPSGDARAPADGKGAGAFSGPVTLTSGGKAAPDNGYRVLKRWLDCSGAAILSFVLSPLAALAVLIVALDVGFPIVFWQQRPGRHGKRFRVYKFRTMCDSHDPDGKPVPDCERLSPAGRFLRGTRLDELPQLYNILVGDMSFVGPRPLLAAEQGHVDPSRLAVRPGLTGWAQVNGGRNISVEAKAALDLWYVREMSLGLDVSILIRTARTLFYGDRPNLTAIRQAFDAQAPGCLAGSLDAAAAVLHVNAKAANKRAGCAPTPVALIGEQRDTTTRLRGVRRLAPGVPGGGRDVAPIAAD